jgi:hypothetical protein
MNCKAVVKVTKPFGIQTAKQVICAKRTLRRFLVASNSFGRDQMVAKAQFVIHQVLSD